MNVLVLGASGFLGSGILTAFDRRGWSTYAGVHRRPIEPDPGARQVQVDVLQPGLGLDAKVRRQLQSECTHVVASFGPVSWRFSDAMDVHWYGTQNVLEFARSCKRLELVVHISSVAALGETLAAPTSRGRVRFRNWYEYGKFLAEREVRAATDVPVRALRFGPLLGVGPTGGGPAVDAGLLSILPYALRNYPLPLVHGGDFPCYATDVWGASEVVARAIENGEAGTWTWFDPSMPTLASVLTDLCAAWSVVPRIVEGSPPAWMARRVARRLGAPRSLVDYTRPWYPLDSSHISRIQGGPVPVSDDYIRLTGEALRSRATMTTAHAW